MANPANYFKQGNKVNLGKRNAAKEYRLSFTREAFNRRKGDIEIIFDKVIETAKGNSDNWLDAAKLLFKHFITTPPAEIALSQEPQEEQECTSDELKEIAKSLTSQGMEESAAYRFMIAVSDAMKRVIARRRETIAFPKAEEPLQPTQSHNVSSENHEHSRH